MRSSRRVLAVTAGMIVSMAFLVNVSAEDLASPEWKVLVYLDADNDLDIEAGLYHEDIVQIDLDELMTVGSNEYVDVFVLMDRFEDTASLLKVHEGSLEVIDYEALSGLELNMGSGAVLEEFVDYTEQVSSAPNTCLFFWDHGSPEGVAWDDNTGEGEEGDWLTHWEVIAALKSHDVDVIATDECMTGQVEVAYEYHAGLPGLTYAVLSECYTGWRGFTYDAILERLSSPGVSPRELTEIILEETYQYFLDPPFMSELVTSHTGVDMYALDRLVEDLGDLGVLLSDESEVRDTVISYAACQANILYGEKTTGFVDLMTFAETIAGRVTSYAVKQACAEVVASLSAAVVGIADSHVSDDFQRGLGIWVPHSSPETLADYERYCFSQEGWLGFLQTYWA